MIHNLILVATVIRRYIRLVYKTM